MGARYAGKQWKLEGAAFNLSFSNQIVYVNTPPVYYKNLGKTSRRGIETRTGYAFERGGALAGLRADATYAYYQGHEKQGVYSTNEVPFYSRHTDSEGLLYAAPGF
ncbi:TonB-dependent receptor domain-containing protein [Massilia sp. MB5]|uniref:TonB-dependent receptor domain-containing protein n=1 Tax=Massilia sp. MB5 TaxID=2919578 RepID=UPI0035A35F0D